MPSCVFAGVFHRRCRKITKKSHDNRNRVNEREHEKQNSQITKVSSRFTKLLRYIKIKIKIINIKTN